MAELSEEILRLYGKGVLTGTQVNSIAAAAWKDGWGRGCVLATKLAKLTAYVGRRACMPRDNARAARAAGMMDTTAEPYLIDLPGGKGKAEVYLPHEVMVLDVAERGLEPLCMDPASLAASELGGTLRAWAEHSDVAYDGDLTQVMGLGFHCDGATYSSAIRAGSQRSLFVGSWNVITGSSADVRNIRYRCFLVSKLKLCGCGCAGCCTFNAIYEVVAWSMKVMLSGQAPTCRYDGSTWMDWDRTVRLARDERVPTAALLQVRRDWEHVVQAFRLRSYKGDNFGYKCNTTMSDGPLCCLDFSPTAAHRDQLVTHTHNSLRVVRRSPAVSREVLH
jgi:hypothetical protein